MAGSGSVRISPRPGAATQNARASSVAIESGHEGGIREHGHGRTARAGGVRGDAREPAPAPAVAWTAVVVSTIAALLDVADGWVARRTGTSTAFGARFDMEVDALLVMVLSVLAWRWDKAGSWVLLSGLLRYAFVAAGWLLPWLQKSAAAEPQAQDDLRGPDRCAHRRRSGRSSRLRSARSSPPPAC